MNRIGMRGVSVCLLGACAAWASAHGEDADFGLVVQNGRIVVGHGDHTTGLITEIGERVFAAEMAFNGAFVASDEPGIFIQPGTFDPGTGIGFVIPRALRVWNTTDGHFFDIAPDPMTLAFGPNSVLTPGADTPVTGFNINYDGGAFDEHYDYLLPGATVHGIYLLELRFTATDPTVAASDSIWTVFNYGLDEGAHEASIEWVEANLVPTPGAGATVLGALLLAPRRRAKYSRV